jgi:dihydrofolate reductase
MGRKTWDSLPERFRPLPGRRNVVLSRQADLPTPGAELAPSLAQALDRLQGAPRIFVIGGEQIYRLALPLADQLCLTEIAQDFDGDAWFPAWSRTDFVELDRRELPSSTPGGLDLAFVTYQRQTPRI